MTNGDILVSIIVPVYGTEAYLPACIDSIRNQSYANVQIILIDDQSPDLCPEICDMYAKQDPRILVIHQENKGVSGARNTGIRHASGEYIMFVDSDDELEANAIELLLQDIVCHNADIASASKSIVSADGAVNPLDDDGSIYIYEGKEMLKRSLAYDRYTHSLHSKLFVSGLVRDVQFEEGHNINEDSYFLFVCFTKQPKVVQHNVSVYKYYLRENSSSRDKFSEKYIDMLYFCDLKRKYIQENVPSLMECAKSMEVRTNLLFLQVLCRTADKKYKAVQRQCLRTVRTLYSSHKPINEHHKMLAWVAAHGLYPLYKWAVRMKYHR